MTKNSLAIIVLNWNCADDSIACVQSLLSQSPHAPDIYIVDNNSSDDSVAQIKTFVAAHQTSPIWLIESSVNGGYTAGNNLGFSEALAHDYEYVGTLNPDAVADSRWSASLLAELINHPDTGIATGILARSNREHVDSTGDSYTTWGIPSPRGRNSKLADAPKSAEYVFGSTGGGFVARAEMLRDIGLFDEKYFMYFEDVDLCFRAQLAGYKVRYTPKAIAYHKISASTNKVPGLATKQTFKNLPMLLTKNVPLRLCAHIYPRFVLSYFLILGHAIVGGRGMPAIKGFLLSWVLIPHMFKERWRIQKSRRVSDDYIDSIILHDIPPEQTGLRKFRKIFTGK